MMKLWGITIFFVTAAHAAGPHKVVVKWGESFEAPRWMFQKKPEVGTGLGADLFNAKQSAGKGQGEACLKALDGAGKKAEILEPWLAAWRLHCARLIFQSKKKDLKRVDTVVKTVRDNPAWLFRGPQAERVRREYIDTSIMLLDEELRRDRARAWENISRLQEITQWMTDVQRARLFKLAGDLSLFEKRMELAESFYERSLKARRDVSVRARLAQIAKTTGKKIEIAEAQPEVPVVDASDAELELQRRMNSALEKNDWLAAVEDGVKLIKEYPGGVRADRAANEIKKIYLNLSRKEDPKLQRLKTDLLKEMRKADAQRILDWAMTMIGRELYADALEVTRESVEKIGDVPIAAKVFDAIVMASYQSADFSTARKHLELVVRNNAGTKTGADALFRLGVLDFREKKYSECVTKLERYILLPGDKNHEASALHWLWRAYQKVGAERAEATRARLAQEYPLTYYGLRARAEASEGKLTLPSELEKVPEVTFIFTDAEMESWQRFQLLLKGGWFDEAQEELRTLPEPRGGDSYLIFASLWAQAFQYLKASDYLQRAYKENPKLVTLSTIRVVYPLEFREFIEKEAAKYELQPELIWALMRQESSFRLDARSPVGATGLMQLMPRTAMEIAKELRVPLRRPAEDLTDPEVNIRLGTNYLHRRLRYFSGHVPLALGAYNAGIGNIRGWLKSRTDLGELTKQPSSDPEHEVWFDEMPWSETSFYIKAILRNYLLYRLLDEGEFLISEPVWSTEKKTADST